MKKRLRKKLRLAEFTQLGFELEATLSDASDERASFVMDALVDLAEAEHLALAGGVVHGQLSVFIVAGRRGSVTPEQRARLASAIAAMPEVLRFTAGPLIDAWYE